MDNKIITDKRVIDRLNFYVSKSRSSKGYEIGYPLGIINYYLCTDGSVREFAWMYHKDVAFYATEALAQEALDRYNKKETDMKKCDLKTGMNVRLRHGDRYYVLLGTPQGDIIATARANGGYLKLDNYNDDMIYIDGCTDGGAWDIMEVNDSANFGATISDYKKVLWTRPISVTVMTITEIQEKLGITNLHIKD